MAKQTIVEDGVRYEALDFEDEDEPSDRSTEQPSETESPAGGRDARQSTGSTARRAAPAARVTVESSEEDEDVNLDEAEAELDEYVASLVEKQVREARADVQRSKDREIAKANSRVDALNKELQELKQRLEESKLEELTEDERQAYLDRKELEKRKAELDEYADELDTLYKERLIVEYVNQYADFGVTTQDLEAIDDPDDMEAFCQKKELEFYRSGGKKTSEEASASRPARRGVPAGARAPTDIGGTSPATSMPKGPVEGTGMEAMAKSLENMPWETVRIGGR